MTAFSPLDRTPAEDRAARHVDVARLLQRALADAGATLSDCARACAVSVAHFARWTDPNEQVSIPFKDVLALPPLVRGRFLELLAESLDRGTVERVDGLEDADPMQLITRLQRAAGDVTVALGGMLRGDVGPQRRAELVHDGAELEAIGRTVRVVSDASAVVRMPARRSTR